MAKNSHREGVAHGGENDALHEDDLRKLWLEAYYELFNQHEPFLNGLTALFDKHKPTRITQGPTSPSEAALEEYLGNLAGQAAAGARNPKEAKAIEEHLLSLGPTGRPRRKPPKALGGFWQNSSQPSSVMETDFAQFAERWSLPADAWEANPAKAKFPDLYWSFTVWMRDKSIAPRLALGPVIMEITVRPRTIRHSGTIFDWDASLTTAATARRQLQVIHKHEEAELRAAEKEARRQGWAWFSAAHSEPEDRKPYIRRVFERRVLRKTWNEIIKGDQVRTAQKSVAYLERLLRLPALKPGRPPHKKRTR